MAADVSAKADGAGFPSMIGAIRSLSFTRRHRHDSSASHATDDRSSTSSVASGLPVQLDVTAVMPTEETRRASRIPFTKKRSSRAGLVAEDLLPPSTVRILTVDEESLVLPMTLHTTVGQLVRTCASELGLADGQHSSFALYQIKHDGTHLLLRDELPISAVLQAKPSRRHMLHLTWLVQQPAAPRLLFKKRLYVKADEALMNTSARFLHLVFIQAVDTVLRGELNVTLSDAVKLASIQFYVRFGPFKQGGTEFTQAFMKEQRLVEQLVPSTLLAKHAEPEWASKVLSSHQKISALFTQLSEQGNTFVTRDEAKRTYLKKARARVHTRRSRAR